VPTQSPELEKKEEVEKEEGVAATAAVIVPTVIKTEVAPEVT